MKVYIIIFFSFFQSAICQTKEIKSQILTASQVEIAAAFPGGIEKFYKYVENNINHPDTENSYSGEIIMSYTVGIDGYLTDIKLIKNNMGKVGNEFATEAIRVLKLCPKWYPASVNGKVIPQTNEIPIKISNF